MVKKKQGLSKADEAGIRAAVNILLEKIAARFDEWETWDVWRSEAADLVRSYKHPSPRG